MIEHTDKIFSYSRRFEVFTLMKKIVVLSMFFALFLAAGFAVQNGLIELNSAAAIAGEHNNNDDHGQSNSNSSSESGEYESEHGSPGSTAHTPTCDCPPGVACECPDGFPGNTSGAPAAAGPSQYRSF